MGSIFIKWEPETAYPVLKDDPKLTAFISKIARNYPFWASNSYNHWPGPAIVPRGTMFTDLPAGSARPSRPAFHVAPSPSNWLTGLPEGPDNANFYTSQ